MIATERQKRAIRKLYREMDRRDEAAKTQRPYRVEGRAADGSALFRALDSGECVERGSQCAVYEGQIVRQPCRPGFTLQGASGLAMLSTRRAVSRPTLTHLDPEVFTVGTSFTVEVHGTGFMPITVLNFLAAPGSREIHEGVTVDEIRFVSEVLLEVDITVDADAEIPLDPQTLEPLALPVAFDNPGMPL